jgi:uncharacterized membrane protein YgcG
MGRSLLVITLGLAGLLCAAGIGLAAYVVSRDSVAVPVTRLQPRPQSLTPARVRRAKVARPRTTTTVTRTATAPTTTADDHGGSRGSGGGGSGNSGHGGGGDD